ncbi:MAG TPA: hypothetical protein VFL86_08055 [Burkholderiaceae bacterium]|nr:hypothetical protein [Burkholderiaceae bacterium]
MDTNLQAPAAPIRRRVFSVPPLLQHRVQAAAQWLASARQSAPVWMLSLCLGIVALGALMQAGYQVERRALQHQQVAPLLAELARQVEAGRAIGAGLTPDSMIQARLDQALAQSLHLQAIDIVAPDGRVLLSTGRGRLDMLPAAEGSPSVHLVDASGQPAGEVLARVPLTEADRLSLAPGTWGLALALPLLALALALRAVWRAGPGTAATLQAETQAATRRGPWLCTARVWWLGFAVLTFAAGLLLAGAAGRLQRHLDDAAAAPVKRAAMVLALRVGQAVDAGIPLEQLQGLNALLRQRLREAPGVAEIRLHDLQGAPLAIQAGPVRADATAPAEVAAVLHDGVRIAEVRVQRTPPRTPWLLLDILGVASALVAVGLLLIGHELVLQAQPGVAAHGAGSPWLRLRSSGPAAPTEDAPIAEPMAGVLIGAALALAAAALVRSDASLALAALAGPALVVLAACVAWRWGRALAAQRLLSGALIATAWCLVQG